jgi:hypothetical protein
MDGQFGCPVGFNRYSVPSTASFLSILLQLDTKTYPGVITAQQILGVQDWSAILPAEHDAGYHQQGKALFDTQLAGDNLACCVCFYGLVNVRDPNLVSLA